MPIGAADERETVIPMRAVDSPKLLRETSLKHFALPGATYMIIHLAGVEPGQADLLSR